MFNVLRTVISQFQNSSTLLALIKNMDVYIDPGADIQAFHDYVWNVDTAQGFGLDLWGKVVGVGRVLKIPVSPAQIDTNGAAITQSYSLSDADYRTLILAKALSNISGSSARSLNQLLQNLYAARGRCYVNDTGRMTMRYVFEFPLTPVDVAIIKASGVFSHPAGVQTYAYQMISTNTFAFNGGSGVPFGQGVFNNPSSLFSIT